MFFEHGHSIFKATDTLSYIATVYEFINLSVLIAGTVCDSVNLDFF